MECMAWVHLTSINKVSARGTCGLLCDKHQLLEAVILPRILLVTPGSFVEIQKLDICVALPAR